MRSGRLQGIFLTLATYKLETLHYYVNVAAPRNATEKFHNIQYATAGKEARIAQHRKIIHIYCRTKQFTNVNWHGCEVECRLIKCLMRPSLHLKENKKAGNKNRCFAKVTAENSPM